MAAAGVVQGICGEGDVSRSKTSRIGRATVQSYCLPCHSMSAVTDVRLSPQEWREIIEEMVELEAEIPPQKREIIYRYLVENFSTASTQPDAAPSSLERSSGSPDAARSAPAGERGTAEESDAASAEGTIAAGDPVAAGGPVAMGRRIYEDFGCDNCHTIDRIGAKGLQGPELGNAGAVLSRQEILAKLEDPRVFYADGYQDKYEENAMPLYDLTSDEIDALTAFLGSLRDGKLHTPRAILPETPPGPSPGPDADAQSGDTL